MMMPRNQAQQRPLRGRLGSSRLFLVAVIFSCSFLAFHTQIREIEVRDEQDIVSASIDKRQRQTSSLSAIDIVHSAYNETYALIQLCPKDIQLRRCLSTIYDSHKQLSYPWWFRTLLRDASDYKTGVFGFWHKLVSSNPPVTMCTMEKIASTQWRKVFCALDPPSNVIKCSRDTPRGSFPERSSKFPKFVFVRDPLERFLSAFLDKCVHRVTEGSCGPIPVLEERNLTTGLIHDKKLLFETYVDTMALKWNIHFVPMGLLCDGLYQNIDDYDFVGNMGPGFYSDVQQLGQRYGISQVLNDVFDLDKHLNATNHGVETSAVLHVEEYYTAATLRRVLQYVSLDYVSLNLPIPEWADRMLRDEKSTPSNGLSTL